METEPKPRYTIQDLSAENIDEANEMRLRSWLDTYVNDELGVSREWVQDRNSTQMSDETKKRRLERLKDPRCKGWVACDQTSRVIGITTPFVGEEGAQHVGSLYVDKDWHGSGVASQLMQKVIDWFDADKPIVLGVASYNERAKAFYRKWGFEEVPGSETLFNDKIAEI